MLLLLADSCNISRPRTDPSGRGLGPGVHRKSTPPPVSIFDVMGRWRHFCLSCTGFRPSSLCDCRTVDDPGTRPTRCHSKPVVWLLREFQFGPLAARKKFGTIGRSICVGGMMSPLSSSPTRRSSWLGASAVRGRGPVYRLKICRPAGD